MRKVNPSGTYDVYFPEDSEALEDVPDSDIKVPINTGKTSNVLSKYIGNVFFDPGSDGKDPRVPFFEAGEFVVDSIVEDNNFLCKAIGDNDDRRDVFDR